MHELSHHTDKQFVDLILQGLKKGFRIGFQSSKCKLRPVATNLVSAVAHPQVVSAYIAEELELWRIACVGLASSDAVILSNIHISPLGVIPKKGHTNQWRMIMDLSSPSAWGGVNDGISKDACSCQYTSVMVAA